VRNRTREGEYWSCCLSGKIANLVQVLVKSMLGRE
jgi:hypothetical protein